MPIQNIGTLLENIVLVEAFRVLASGAHPTTTIDFVNSFAMPPLSDWGAHYFDCGLKPATLEALRKGPPVEPSDSYGGMMWSCLQQPAARAGTEGPNGTLLCAIMAYHLQRSVRLWLNDIPNGHYGNALPALANINKTVQDVLELGVPPEYPVVSCDQGWPDCLTPPRQSNLQGTLRAWGNSAHARLGFLDPMRYRIDKAQGAETDSLSHRRWLALLSDGFPRTVISVHFTGHRDQEKLLSEIMSMHEDGVSQGYSHTLIARHGHYHVVSSVRHANGVDAADRLTAELQRAVELAWLAWFDALERKAARLTFEVKGPIAAA